jgi:membrane-associated protein
MSWIHQFLDFVLHLSDRLDALAGDHPSGVLGVLFLVVFCETGLVITPFLPGDSLLFAVGAVAARGKLDPLTAALTLMAAAFLGDNVNYWVGSASGKSLVRNFPKLVRGEHLERTHAFFEKHGRKTIILARFVPIIRTFTPFVAGMGSMGYARFLLTSLAATLLWVGLILPAGWFFGNWAPVKKHFELVVIGIVVVSVMPMVFEALKARRSNAK